MTEKTEDKPYLVVYTNDVVKPYPLFVVAVEAINAEEAILEAQST